MTKNFIETALADREAECDVVVTSQRLIEMDEANSERRSLRVQRALSSGLEVDLDLSCTATRSGDNADIKELILAELSNNSGEYKQLLADNAPFFIQYNQRVEQMLPNKAAMMTPEEESKAGTGKIVGIIFGVFASLFVFAVSMYTVRERIRSNGTAPLRVINEDEHEFYDSRPSRRALTVINEDENDTYDLNAISKTNDNVVKSRPQTSEPQPPQPRKEMVSQKLGMMSEAIKNKSKTKIKVSLFECQLSTSPFYFARGSPSFVLQCCFSFIV